MEGVEIGKTGYKERDLLKGYPAVEKVKSGSHPNWKDMCRGIDNILLDIGPDVRESKSFEDRKVR